MGEERDREIEVEDIATCKVVVPPIGKKDRREKRKFDSPPPPFSKMREFGGCCRMLQQHRKSGAIAWRAIQAATTTLSGMQATMQDFFSIVGGLLLSFSQTSIEAKVVKLPA